MRVYLTEGEVPPTQNCKHKNHITKVMFLCAVARPRYDETGLLLFDGKIGIWPFVEKVAARNNSINRPAGTLETKGVSVNKAVYTDYLCSKVLPTIKDKFNTLNQALIEIQLQHDNAKTHFGEDETTPLSWLEASTRGDWNITRTPQPANSPDFNILDLAFFCSLQSRQWEHGFASNIDELIKQVQRAYVEYPPQKLDYAFVTLQTVLDETLKNAGTNNYKIPHLNKERRRRLGTLYHRRCVSDDAMKVFDAFWEGNLPMI